LKKQKLKELDTIRQAFERILPLPEKEWQDLSTLLTIKTFPQGSFLIREPSGSAGSSPNTNTPNG
jgi:hypothetical protein